MKLAKNFLDESEHRRKLDNKAADLAVWNEKVGRITATAFAFFCVIMAVWLGFYGHTVLASILVTSVTAQIVTVLLTGRADENNDNDPVESEDDTS